MSTDIRTKACPKCGGTATNQPTQSTLHTGHVLHQALHTGNPVMIGLGLLNAAWQGMKHHTFTCKCGHTFRGW